MLNPVTPSSVNTCTNEYDIAMGSMFMASAICRQGMYTGSDSLTSETLTNVEPTMLDANTEINKYFKKIGGISLDEAPASLWKVNSYDLFEQLLDKSEKLTNVRGIDKVTYLRPKKNLMRFESVPLLTQDDFNMILNFNKTKMDSSVTYTSPKDWFFGKNTKMRTFVNKLCAYYYSGVNVKRALLGNYVSDEGNCKIDPYKYLSISGAKYVLDITKQPVKSNGSNQRGIYVGTNNSAGASKSHSKNWGWRFSFGLKIPAILLTGAGADVNYGESWSNGTSLGEGVSFGESQGLDVEETVLEFEAKTRACVVFRAKGEVIRKGLTKGLRICEKADKVETVKEHWYQLNEPWRRRSFIADPGAENAMRLYNLIRGQVNFKIFKDKIESSNNNLV